MPFMMKRRQLLMTASAATAAALAPRRAFAQQTLDVEMLNRHPEERINMVFYPDIIVAQPGDTLRFIPTDRGHNTVSVDGMLPDGADDWRGGINEEVELNLQVPGFYGYVCQPHVSLDCRRRRRQDGQLRSGEIRQPQAASPARQVRRPV